VHKPLRLALLIGGLVLAAQSSAAIDLALVRSGVGVTGGPRQLAGHLDVNGNGRRELLVAARWHVTLAEEDAGPRGYREVARIDAPSYQEFGGALLVDVPGAAPALLLQWSGRLELRDAATLRIKASLDGQFGWPLLGDVDGDGLPEIVVESGNGVALLDPATLAARGNVGGWIGAMAAADIVGDARAEIVSGDGRAYTVTRSGSELSATEVWNAGIAGTWIPYPVDVDGHTAIVLHDSFGFSAQLATFRPTPSLRTLVPADGPSFVPRFADVNGDGRVDLVAATGSTVRALDIASGATLWERDTIYQPPYIGSVAFPATADLDGDGTVEIAWADASYDSGVVAASAPIAGAPRWRSDRNQSRVADWTRVRRADGSSSIAYLTYATETYPRLRTLGFLDGVTLADEGGSALAWLPDYNGYSRSIVQHAVAALPVAGDGDAVVVSGAELPMFGGTPLARWLWTFDGTGALVSSRALASTTDPQRIAVAQVLDRPERQVVTAGWIPFPTSGASAWTARVEVVDYATGAVLWQSVLLPSYDGAPLTKLAVADLDGDGRLEVVVAYGDKVAVLTPASGTGVVANYPAQTFSVLARGPGRSAKLATLRNTDVAVYDGVSVVPLKTFVLPDYAQDIALFAQAPDDALLFATSGYGGLAVRRYADGDVVATSRPPSGVGGMSLAATDADGDRRVDIVGSDPGFMVWRLDNDYIFRGAFD
jgi:hypothetical protein